MIIETLNTSVDALLTERLRDFKQRDRIVAAVMDGFSRVRKSTVPDLQKRLEQLEAGIWTLTENIQLRFLHGRPVVKVAGSSEALLEQLRRGTDWYEPWDDIDRILLAAVLIDPKQ